jgi:hypothetical protein
MKPEELEELGGVGDSLKSCWAKKGRPFTMRAINGGRTFNKLTCERILLLEFPKKSLSTAPPGYVN